MNIESMDAALKSIYYQAYKYPKYMAGPVCFSWPLEVADWEHVKKAQDGIPDRKTEHLDWNLGTSYDGDKTTYHGCDEIERHATVNQDKDGQWWWYCCCPPWMSMTKCDSLHDGMIKADRHYAGENRQ